MKCEHLKVARPWRKIDSYTDYTAEGCCVIVNCLCSFSTCATCPMRYVSRFRRFQSRKSFLQRLTRLVKVSTAVSSFSDMIPWRKRTKQGWWYEPGNFIYPMMHRFFCTFAVSIFLRFSFYYSKYIFCQRECFGRRYWLTCRPITRQSTQMLRVACEQQTHFRSSLLSLLFFGGREATTGNASAVRRLKLREGSEQDLCFSTSCFDVCW